MLAILEGPDLIIVLVVVLVLFGGAQLPKLARGLGEAQREFRKGLHDVTGGPDPNRVNEGPAQQAHAPAVPVAPAPSGPASSGPTTPAAAAPVPAAPVPAAPKAPDTTSGQPRTDRVQGPLKVPPIPPTAGPQPVVNPAEPANAPQPVNGQHAPASGSIPSAPTGPAPAPRGPIQGTNRPESETPPV